MRGVIDVMDVIGIFRPKSRIWESSTWRRICRYFLPCYDLGNPVKLTKIYLCLTFDYKKLVDQFGINLVIGNGSVEGADE